MRKYLILFFGAALCVQAFALEQIEFPLNNGLRYTWEDYTVLNPEPVGFSFLHNQTDGMSGSNISEKFAYKTEEQDNSAVFSLFDIAEEFSPAVERYMFDDNVTETQLYMGLSSALLSYTFRKMTDNLIDLRLHEDIKDDNKSLYSVEFGIRPTPFFGLNFLVPNGEYRFGLSLFPSENSAISFSINDNQTTTVTGIDLNAVF
jgi:hypothetical protein